jgi:hypothetical protein
LPLFLHTSVLLASCPRNEAIATSVHHYRPYLVVELADGTLGEVPRHLLCLFLNLR